MTPEEISINENFWYPLYLLLIGGSMTGIAIPIINKLHEIKQIKIAREREDHQKELEIKSEIIKKISSVVIQGLIKIYDLSDQEIQKESIKLNFKDITKIYDYVWYGEFNIDELKFESLKIAFNNLNNSLATR